MTTTDRTGNDPHTVKPCDTCPMFVWGFLHDPTSIEGERHIRADERLRFQRTFDMWAKQLERANEEIARLNATIRRLEAKAS